MEKICSDNFKMIFSTFEKMLNALFQGKTKFLEGGNIRISKSAGPYRYKKRLVSKDDVTIEIKVLYDKENDDYLCYTYNIFFGSSKLMFHYEPSHKEHFQPHVNVYTDGNELRNFRGDGIHIISHKYHLLEILAMIERYFV